MSVRSSLRRFCSFGSVRRASSLKPVLEVKIAPGSRMIELASPSQGNYLSNNLIDSLQSKLESYKDNTIVDVLFFYSRSTGENFSLGVDEKDFRASQVKYCESINKVATTISEHNKATISVFSGNCSGTALGVFAGAKYCLGTPSASVCIDDLFKGVIPMGGLAYHMAQGSEFGVEWARFLAISKIKISNLDLYNLGIVTHLVEEDPYDNLSHAIAHTIPDNALKHSDVQEPGTDITALEDLLSTMHVDSETNEDVLKHESWDKLLVVPIQEWEPETMKSCLPTDNLEYFLPFVEDIFDTDDVEETKKMLEGWANDEEDCPERDLARLCLKNMETLNALNDKLLPEWYQHTRFAQEDSYSSVLAREANFNCN